MGGDYSKRTFDPKKDFSGVIMQQGRVQLDSDWNELIEIQDRRLRAETVDIMGRCVVPKETPGGFKIDISSRTIIIGRGRIYVDGLLAENYGGGNQKFDAVLGEMCGSDSVSYYEQPYYPNLDKLKQGVSYLFYIDVWQREVTHLESPGLIEKAVNVDTTTRLQTVWQVKVHALQAGSNVTCSTSDKDISGWDDLVRPSAGRLSTGTTVNVSDSADPCLPPPTSGYRGLENQLYRVEIHTGGPPETATFKWSRDNASVATNVTAIPAFDQLVVESVGRDDVLRFHPGDWVEITDDWHEFAGQPGEIRKIKGVDNATRTIFLESGLTPNVFPTGSQNKTDPARHIRIRRWDQKGKVYKRDSNGNLNLLKDLDSSNSDVVIPVCVGIDIILENGIHVKFSTDPDGGNFRAGDYWVFAARTADASVEVLDEAPPRGIHHHYGRLAVVTLPNTVSDCRTFWPPEGKEGKEGCCTVVVHPGEDIQAAIDSLGEYGGCVCLKAGEHIINKPIQINKSNIVLHGECNGAMICQTAVAVNEGDINKLLVIQSDSDFNIENIKVEGIQFAVNNEKNSIIIYVNKTNNITIQNCTIKLSYGFRSTGISIYNSNEVSIHDNLIKAEKSNDFTGVSLMNINRLFINSNSISNAKSGIVVFYLSQTFNATDIEIIGNKIDHPKMGDAGILIEGGVLDSHCHVERNLVLNYPVGIFIGGIEQATIAYNKIFRKEIEEAKINVAEGEKSYGIAVASSHCAIVGNYLDLNAPIYGGIKSTGSYSLIEGNTIKSTIGLSQEEVLKIIETFIPSAESEAVLKQIISKIPVGISLDMMDFAPDYSIVKHNTLTGFQLAIMAMDTEGVQILNNHIDGEHQHNLDKIHATTEIHTLAGSNLHDPISFKKRMSICAVMLRHTNSSLISGNKIRCTSFGILSLEGSKDRIVTNHLSEGILGITLYEAISVKVSENIIENMESIGLMMGSLTGLTTITHNRIAFCGSRVGMGVCIIFASDVCIESCEVLNTGISPAGQLESELAYGIWVSSVQSCRIKENHVAYTDINALDFAVKEHRALLLSNIDSYALVTDNTFSGVGYTHLIELQLGEKSIGTFNNNICRHFKADVTGDKDQATVSIKGSPLIVMGNHVIADNGKFPSMNFYDASKIALMGNVTTGGFIKLEPSSYKPLPENDYNI